MDPSCANIAPAIFEGHLCLAEFCLCGADGHAHITESARELLAIAESAGSIAGRSLATLILGEVELFSGHLDSAEQLLGHAGQMYEQIDITFGRVLSLRRLTELALARGQKYRAGRLLQKAFRVAEESWLTPHWSMLLQGLAIETAATTAQTIEAIHQGDRLMAGQKVCQPCSMSFRVVASITLAKAGDLEQAGRRLDETERLAGM